MRGKERSWTIWEFLARLVHTLKRKSSPFLYRFSSTSVVFLFFFFFYLLHIVSSVRFFDVRCKIREAPAILYYSVLSIMLYYSAFVHGLLLPTVPTYLLLHISWMEKYSYLIFTTYFKNSLGERKRKTLDVSSPKGNNFTWISDNPTRYVLDDVSLCPFIPKPVQGWSTLPFFY